MVVRSVGGLLSSGSDVSGRLSAVCPCLFEPSRVQTRVILGDLIRGIIMRFTGPLICWPCPGRLSTGESPQQ